MNAITYASGRFAPDNENLAIWLRNEPTDTAATKSFSRTGGFKGTAVNATYIVKRLTAEFGPVGHGWGVDVVAEDIFEGAPVRADNGTLLGNEKVHRLRVRFWWLDPKSGQKCGFDQMGQTTFVGRNKNGWFTDEEAPKKSLTDALTKAASWLGFAGDIHLGLWDDNRYVAARQQAEQAPPPHSVWTILSRDGVGTDYGNKDKYLSEWRIKISAVTKADKPAEKRVATLQAMEKANEPAFDDLVEAEHAEVVESVRGMVHRAIEKLKPLLPKAEEPPPPASDPTPEPEIAGDRSEPPGDEPPPPDDVPYLDDEPPPPPAPPKPASKDRVWTDNLIAGIAQAASPTRWRTVPEMFARFNTLSPDLAEEIEQAEAARKAEVSRRVRAEA